MPKNKDYETANKHFLFYTGGGKILNGLDLLIEIFKKKPELTLHICGTFSGENDFYECFKNDIISYNNIIMEGWVQVGSEKILDLVKKCGYVIVPICAGASHGSVVVCMNYGVVPIVTKEAGIDLEDFGVLLPSYEIDDIEEKIEWVSKQPAEWLKKRSLKTKAAAENKFSEKSFFTRFTEILDEIHK